MPHPDSLEKTSWRFVPISDDRHDVYGERHRSRVEFDSHCPSDPGYNDVFLALSVDLSDALETDTVDLVDLRPVAPALAEAIFETGVLLVGEQEHAAARRGHLTGNDETRSPRERLDRALARIDEHLGDFGSGARATADSRDEP